MITNIMSTAELHIETLPQAVTSNILDTANNSTTLYKIVGKRYIVKENNFELICTRVLFENHWKAIV